MAGQGDPSSDAFSLLRGLAIRCTPARVAVLGAVRAAGRPQSAADVVAVLGPSTDPVTVYRTLQLFADVGLLHRVKGNGRDFFGFWEEGAGRREHPHFTCVLCGRITCLSEAHLPPNQLRPAQLPENYVVTQAEVMYHGVCPACSRPDRGVHPSARRPDRDMARGAAVDGGELGSTR